MDQIVERAECLINGGLGGRQVNVVDVTVVGVQPAKACLASGNDRATRRAS
jgi:hypothetical protein